MSSSSRRAKDKTAISISLPKNLRKLIDERAKSLHITRSEYLVQLASSDIQRGGPLIITPDGQSPHQKAS